MQWLPIETAPKDGTQILVCTAKYEYGGFLWVSYFEKGCWQGYYEDPEFWMPLPEVPSREAK